jgi:hypothetical protein
MIKAFFVNWLGAFRDGWSAARALPLLVVAMMGIEFAQHAVELHIGFFSPDLAVHKAASLAPVRMLFGWPKMLTLYLVAFIALRWFVSRDAHAAIRPSALALRRYVWVVLFQLIPAAAIIYAGSIVAVVGRSPDDIMAFRAVFGLGQQLLEPFLLLWYVNAAAGTHAYGPLASAKATGWLYLWALPLSLATRVPLSLLHGRLNMWPVGQPPLLQWALLALDALVVGMLAVIMPAIQVRIARYVAAGRDTALLGEHPLPAAPTDGPLQVA